MKKFILYKNFGNYWGVADLEHYDKNGKLKESIHINKFYQINGDWFEIYDAAGGGGIGWQKGKLLRKIYIGDSEFETKYREEISYGVFKPVREF